MVGAPRRRRAEPIIIGKAIEQGFASAGRGATTECNTIVVCGIQEMP